jgi:xylulokinase
MFIGLDLGTSGLKALLMNEAGAVVAETSAPLTVQRPHSGWSEQTPQSWITATQTALAALGQKTDLSGVTGVGLSGHMHGAVCLDAAGTVLRPAILWNDTRSASEAAEMDATDPWRAISGNIVFPGFTAPKLEWMRRNEPELFAKTACVLLPKDYLRYWLTGETVSEMSDAAGTSWLDVGARDWSPELLAAAGLSVAHMPRLVEGSAPSGTLRSNIATELGLPQGVVVAGGGGDNAASAVGVGAVTPGQAFVSLGTSGVLFAVTAEFSPDPDTAVHTFCHAVPNTWHQMGVILSATDALNWYANLVDEPAASLTAALGNEVRTPGRAMFLPYLGGERTPHNDAQVRAAMIGITHDTDRAAGTQAVVEGVCFALKDNLDALMATGTRIDRLLAVGGGSLSDYWLSALASTLNLSIDRPVNGDFGGAFGAARLGQMAATGAGAEIATPPPIAQSFDPNPNLTGAFADAHQRYTAAYTAIKEIS